ncbi:MAG: type IV-A pilus assembly ATPase PilB [Bdellovibrionales bacterium]
MSAKKAIGELLVRQNFIDVQQLEQARRVQKQHGGRLTSALISLGYVNEMELAEFMGQQYQVPTIDLSIFECAPDAIAMLPRKVCEKYNVIPVSKAGKTLVVAFSDPSNIYVKDDLGLLTRSKIEVVVASEIAINQAIEKYYQGETSKVDSILSDMEDSAEFQVEAEDDAGEDDENVDEPIIKFVNAMLNEAIKVRASDIHIEPYEKRFRIRFRIDGKLIEKTQPPQESAGAVISRIKILSQLDIAERRRPQDGRLKIKRRGMADVDFRVSVCPTMFGEKIVMRLLDKSNLQVDMMKLGFEKDQLAMLTETIHQPQGMVLITGPTGSGKTTTIYSCLAELNSPDVNLSTAEDPVEFNLDGINQVQVNADIGFGFAEALRSFLRQDPDVVMVGEIRDLETANVAYKAASTGHLVVSTLHTNDAASTVSRLLDMGVPQFMVAEATSLVVAQRLMRKNCSNCVVPVKVTNEVLLDLGVPEADLHLFQNTMRGEGCQNCGGSGCSGRIAVHEVLQMTSAVKEAIFNNASPLEIKKNAIASGMMSLRMSALEKLKRGEASVEQVLAATLSDDI